MDPVLEDLEGFVLVGLEVPLELLLLLLVAVLVDELDDAHRDDFVNEGAVLLVVERVFLRVQDLLEHRERLVQPHHVQIEFVPLVL